MNVRLTLQKIRVSPLLKNHVRERLHTALARAERHIRAVTVLLADKNGRRGGGDKRCRIDVELAGGGRVKFQETHADLFHAVSRAADRTGHALLRLLRQNQAPTQG